MSDDKTLYVSDSPHAAGCSISTDSAAGQVVMTAHGLWRPKGAASELTARVVHAANCHADLLAACRAALLWITEDCRERDEIVAAIAKATGVAESPNA